MELGIGQASRQQSSTRRDGLGNSLWHTAVIFAPPNEEDCGSMRRGREKEVKTQIEEGEAFLWSRLHQIGDSS